MNSSSIWKGLCAGFAGGLVASRAMGPAHAVVLKLMKAPVGAQRGEDSTVKTARAVARTVGRRELKPSEAKAAGVMVHYAFGSTVAAAYGAAAEMAPGVTRGAGLPFGAAVWLGAHVVAVPALGLSPPVTQTSAAEEFAEFAAHLVYGGLSELIRRGARRRLGS